MERWRNAPIHVENQRARNRKNPFGHQQVIILQGLIDGDPPPKIRERLGGINSHSFSRCIEKITDRVNEVYKLGEGELTRREALEVAKKLGIERGFLTPKAPPNQPLP